jgi:hypothetical protein
MQSSTAAGYAVNELNHFYNGKFSRTINKKEYSKRKTYSLTEKPKNSVKLHGVLSKTAETDEANGTTSRDPIRIPKHTNELDVSSLKECVARSIRSR